MKKLPIGIGVIGVLVIIEAIVELLGAFGLFGISTLSFFGAQFGLSFALTTMGIVFLVIGLIELAVGIGLFNMEKWAWLVTMIVIWIDLIMDVFAGIIQAQSIGAVLLSMVIPVIILVYMNNKSIKKRFV